MIFALFYWVKHYFFGLLIVYRSTRPLFIYFCLFFFAIIRLLFWTIFFLHKNGLLMSRIFQNRTLFILLLRCTSCRINAAIACSFKYIFPQSIANLSNWVTHLFFLLLLFILLFSPFFIRIYFFGTLFSFSLQHLNWSIFYQR